MSQEKLKYKQDGCESSVANGKSTMSINRVSPEGFSASPSRGPRDSANYTAHVFRQQNHACFLDEKIYKGVIIPALGNR